MDSRKAQSSVSQVLLGRPAFAQGYVSAVSSVFSRIEERVWTNTCPKLCCLLSCIYGETSKDSYKMLIILQFHFLLIFCAFSLCVNSIYALNIRKMLIYSMSLFKFFCTTVTLLRDLLRLKSLLQFKMEVA